MNYARPTALTSLTCTARGVGPDIAGNGTALTTHLSAVVDLAGDRQGPGNRTRTTPAAWPTLADSGDQLTHLVAMPGAGVAPILDKLDNWPAGHQYTTATI